MESVSNTLNLDLDALIEITSDTYILLDVSCKWPVCLSECL